MSHGNSSFLTAGAFALFVLLANVPALPQVAPATSGLPPEALANMAAQAIADAIPREFDRKKDWGSTKRIVTGLRSSGNFFELDVHRKRSEVNHGVWKHYRVTLVEPEENLDVRVENLRSLETGRIAFTLLVATKLHGWARAKVYERGVHLGAYEAEGDAKVRLRIDGEIAVEVTPASFLAGIAVRPHVTDARLAIDEFRLRRISNLSGPVVRELGDSLRGVIEDEVNGPKLVTRLNHSIDKRRDRLVFTPEMLLGAARKPE